MVAHIADYLIQPVAELHLQLTDVGFHYPEMPSLFEHINLGVKQGQMIAIPGDHKQGTRTFMRLLAHPTSPTEGKIYFPAHLRVLFVSQQIYLSNMPLINNVLFGCGFATAWTGISEGAAGPLQQAWKCGFGSGFQLARGRGGPNAEPFSSE